MRFNLAAGGETQFVDGIWVSGSMFEHARGAGDARPARSREADDRARRRPDGPVTVISYAFWQRRFGRIG